MNRGTTAPSALKTAMRGVSATRGAGRAVKGRAFVGPQQQRAFIAPAYNLAKKVREPKRRGVEVDELKVNWPWARALWKTKSPFVLPQAFPLRPFAPCGRERFGLVKQTDWSNPSLITPKGVFFPLKKPVEVWPATELGCTLAVWSTAGRFPDAPTWVTADWWPSFCWSQPGSRTRICSTIFSQVAGSVGWCRKRGEIIFFSKLTSSRLNVRGWKSGAVRDEDDHKVSGDGVPVRPKIAPFEEQLSCSYPPVHNLSWCSTSSMTLPIKFTTQQLLGRTGMDGGLGASSVAVWRAAVQGDLFQASKTVRESQSFNACRPSRLIQSDDGYHVLTRRYFFKPVSDVKSLDFADLFCCPAHWKTKSQ